MRPVDPRLLRAAAAAPLAGAAAAGAIAGLAVLVQARLIAGAVADLAAGRAAAAGSTALALLGVFAGRAVLHWLQEVWGHRAASSAIGRLRHDLARHALQRAGGLDAPARTEITTLTLEGLDALDPYFARYVPQLVAAVVVPAAALAQLAALDLTSALVVGLTLPLIPVFMVLIGRLTEASSRNRLATLERLGHHFLDVVEGMSTLRVFGRGGAQGPLVAETTDRYRRATMSTLRIAFLSSLALELLATLSVAVVAVEVGLRLVDGGLDLRTGLFVILLAPEAYLPLRQIGVHFHSSADGVAAADRAHSLLDVATGSCAGQVTLPSDAGRVRIVVRSLGVQHPGRDTCAPDGLGFVARPGEVTTLHGPSGSGKTTTLAVLLGLRTADHGEVTVEADGAAVALREVELPSWHRLVAWVDQRPYVLEGTVAENLRLADPTADDAALLDAVRRAHLDLDLRRTVSVATMSAGERRRLALARALLRRAPVLLLDEPTAGLDAATEAKVLATVRSEAERGVTVVMASHRPDALAVADAEVVL